MIFIRYSFKVLVFQSYHFMYCSVDYMTARNIISMILLSNLIESLEK